MLPSRYYNHHGEAIFMRRTENGLSLPLSQSYSSLDHFDSNGRLPRRSTPAADTDKPGTAPRRRVPVACERCRKRKIKCSGDEGGSCVNCRNAGMADSCQFMRVASVDPNILRAMRGGTGWQQNSHRYTPYPTVYKTHHQPTSQSAAAAASTSASTSYSNYVPNAYSTTSELSVGLDYTYPIPSNQSPSWPRSNSYVPTYSLYDEQAAASSYSSQATASYSAQANPAFLLPNSDPMTAGSTYLINPPYFKTGSNQQQQLLHESSTPLSSSQPISHLLTTSYPDPAYDQTVSYSTMGTSAQPVAAAAAFKSEQPNGYTSIGGGLPPQPPPSGLSDRTRTLPNPSRQFSVSHHQQHQQHQQQQMQATALDSFPPSIGMVSHRSSLGWLTAGSFSSSGSSASSGQNSCTSSIGSQDLRYSMTASLNSLTTTIAPASVTSISTSDLLNSQSPVAAAFGELGQQQQQQQQQDCNSPLQVNNSLDKSSDSHYACTGSQVLKSSQTNAGDTSSAQAVATNSGDIGVGVAVVVSSYPQPPQPPPEVDLAQDCPPARRGGGGGGTNGGSGGDEFGADCSTCTTSTSTRVSPAAFRNHQLANY